MGENPFIKFYPSDFLAGTSGLSPSERGVYITLICLIYEHDGPIVRDDARLARRCGLPKASFERVISALIDEGKLSERSGRITNKRAEKAIVDRQLRTKNATHAANSKWSAHGEKTEQNQYKNDAGAMRAQCADVCAKDASQSPEPDSKDTSVSLHVHSGPDADALFNEFWDQYPHRGGAKKGKKPARLKWNAAIKRGVEPRDIIRGAIKYASDAMVVRGYAKNPETWLNQEGWTDDTEQNQPAKSDRQSAERDTTDSIIAFASRSRPSSSDDIF